MDTTADGTPSIGTAKRFGSDNEIVEAASVMTVQRGMLGQVGD
jgi:hypothetical protein